MSRLEPHLNQGRLHGHSGQIGGLMQRGVVNVECSSHTYIYAIFVCIVKCWRVAMVLHKNLPANLPFRL